MAPDMSIEVEYAPSIDRLHDESLVREALYAGLRHENPLLLDYCSEWYVSRGIEPPVSLIEGRQDVQELVDKGIVLRWLDMPIDNDADDPTCVLDAKIQRTMKQIDDLNVPGRCMFYVSVPAYNEAEDIGVLIDSVKGQKTDAPVALVVADNNSTDNTAEIVKRAGGNVVPAPVQGIAAARQAALDSILFNSCAGLKSTVIIQTDSDCELAPGYIDAVNEVFSTDPDAYVGVGPSIFDVPLEGGGVLRIQNGKEYAAIARTRNLRDYFAACGRDINDYLLRPPYYLFPGANTVYRAALFPMAGMWYQQDGRWEQHDLSIQFQRAFRSFDRVRRIPGQTVHASPRTILGDGPVLTEARRQELQKNGIGVFKAGGVIGSPLGTVRQTIRDIDRDIYDLQEGEAVDAVVASTEAHDVIGNCEQHERHLIVPAMHGSRDKVVLGKVAVVGIAAGVSLRSMELRSKDWGRHRII